MENVHLYQIDHERKMMEQRERSKETGEEYIEDFVDADAETDEKLKSIKLISQIQGTFSSDAMGE